MSLRISGVKPETGGNQGGRDDDGLEKSDGGAPASKRRSDGEKKGSDNEDLGERIEFGFYMKTNLHSLRYGCVG